MKTTTFQFGFADYSKRELLTPIGSQETMMRTSEPLSEASKKTLHEIKGYSYVIKNFSERLGRESGESRLPPMLLFVKNYLRHYSTALLDKIIDVEFVNSMPYYQNSLDGLRVDLYKLESSFASVFQEDQISEYVKRALDEVLHGTPV
ncbi:unnamed protein product [Caenorhabditis sp. 36 PRJEB53466]|nr:unnamed protein product [Caenorhabditis sp. 36 PRJEB53466]